MMTFEYPTFLPNFSFISPILMVTAINYYINVQPIPKKVKYICTAILLVLVLLIPIPFFLTDRNFGAIPVYVGDPRTYTPVLLLYTIVLLMKYYSIQIETIQANKPIPGIGFVLSFLFLLPHYVYDDKSFKPNLKGKTITKHRQEAFKKMGLLLLQFFICMFIIITIFGFVHVPKDILKACFVKYWAVPLIMGSGIVTICMFMMVSNVLSFASAIYNVGGFDFKYYSNKPFLSTSISQFWRNWNLWTNDWFYIYMYRPLRRTFKLTHSQATLSIFTFSGLIHSYCISMINFKLAWLMFFVFFVNGLVVIAEQPIIERFPWLSKIPTWLKFILTFLYLDFSMGLLGFAFN